MYLFISWDSAMIIASIYWISLILGWGSLGMRLGLWLIAPKGAQLTLQFVVSLLSTGTDTIAASLLVLTPLYNCSNKGGVMA